MIAKYINKVVFDVVTYAEACEVHTAKPNYEGYRPEVRVSPSGQYVVCGLNFGQRTPPKGGCTYEEFSGWKQFIPKGKLVWFFPNWRGEVWPDEPCPDRKEGRILLNRRSTKPKTKAELWEF